MKRGETFRFFAKHFWELMKSQNGSCALTGRKFTPDNVEVELKEPYKESGRTDFSNHYLILRPLAAMARYASEEEIIDLAVEIVKFRGKERGVELKKAARRRKRA